VVGVPRASRAARPVPLVERLLLGLGAVAAGVAEVDARAARRGDHRLVGARGPGRHVLPTAHGGHGDLPGPTIQVAGHRPRRAGGRGGDAARRRVPARRTQRRPGGGSDHAIGAHAAGALELLDRVLGPRTEGAVRGDLVALVPEQLLHLLHRRAAGPYPQGRASAAARGRRRRGPASPQLGPGLRPDDAVRGQPAALLEGLHRRRRPRAEHAVRGELVTLLAKEGLQPLHVRATRALAQHRGRGAARSGVAID
jgi:hypothetical protein